MAATPAAPPAPAPPAATRQPRIYYGYYIVVASIMAWFVMVGAQTQVSGVFLKPMTEELGWTRTEFFYAQTIGQYLVAFVGFFIGAYVDRFGGRAFMVTGVTILGTSLFLTSEVTELWQWIALRGVMFAAGAALMGNLIVNVTLAKWFVRKRGRAVALGAMGVPMGVGIAPLAMTAVVSQFGWRAGWIAIALAAWALIYPAAMVMRRQPEDHGLHPDGMSDEEAQGAAGAAVAADLANSFTRSQAVRTVALYVVVAAFGLSGLALGTTLVQTIPFLTDEGFDRSTAALMLTVYAVPSAWSKPVWGFLIERMSPQLLAAVAFVMYGAALLIISFGASISSVAVLFAGYWIFGMGGGGAVPLQEVIWATFFGRRHIGAVRSVGLPMALTLTAGGPLAVSLYFDRVGNYYGAFVFIAALSMLAAFLILVVRKPTLPGATADAGPASTDEGPPPGDGGGGRDGGAPARDGAADRAGAAAAAAEPVVAGGEDGAGPNGGVATPPPRPAPVRPRRPVRDYMGDR